MPHRYCQNHFLRDVAKPVLEADSHAKVKMRKKVRGLRGIEKEVLEERGRTTFNRERRKLGEKWHIGGMTVGWWRAAAKVRRSRFVTDKCFSHKGLRHRLRRRQFSARRLPSIPNALLHG